MKTSFDNFYKDMIKAIDDANIVFETKTWKLFYCDSIKKILSKIETSNEFAKFVGEIEEFDLDNNGTKEEYPSDDDYDIKCGRYWDIHCIDPEEDTVNNTIVKNWTDHLAIEDGQNDIPDFVFYIELCDGCEVQHYDTIHNYVLEIFINCDFDDNTDLDMVDESNPYDKYTKWYTNVSLNEITETYASYWL